MASLANGQCAHRWPGMGRCLDLATVTRQLPHPQVIYDIPLCAAHASYFDQERPRVWFVQ